MVGVKRYLVRVSVQLIAINIEALGFKIDLLALVGNIKIEL